MTNRRGGRLEKVLVRGDKNEEMEVDDGGKQEGIGGGVDGNEEINTRSMK